MSRIDFYERMANTNVLISHNATINAFNNDVYAANHIHGYVSSPEHSTADQESYESSSSGSGNTSSYEPSEGRSSNCTGDHREPDYANYMNPYDYYNVHKEIHMHPVPQTLSPNAHFISSRGVNHNCCYKTGLVMAPPCSMLPQPCFPSNTRMCDEYLYNAMQYQYSAQSAYYYDDQQYIGHVKMDPTLPRHKYRSSQPAHHLQSENNVRHNHYSDDAVKNLLKHPIKEQIAKYEYLLLKSSQMAKSGRDELKHNEMDKKQLNAQTEKRASQPQRIPAHQYPKTNKIENDQKIEKRPTTKTFLGLYEVLGMIGIGGGGVVYSGIQISDQKPVAIKRIMREKIKRWGLVDGRKVPQEIALMVKVNGHSNVIELLNWYECLDSFVMIMERPNNAIDLFDYIRAVGRVGEEEGAFIFRQVVQAVLHVQEKGVLHRDVKDENVIINNQTKQAKLIDFGCGTPLHSKPYLDFSGTPEFYPPEWYTKKQYYGKPATVWSLGILLYDILCGEIPFKTKSKIIANKLIFKVHLSQHAKHLIQCMLTTDEKFRPSLQDILKHPWLSTKLS